MVNSSNGDFHTNFLSAASLIIYDAQNENIKPESPFQNLQLQKLFNSSPLASKTLNLSQFASLSLSQAEQLKDQILHLLWRRLVATNGITTEKSYQKREEVSIYNRAIHKVKNAQFSDSEGQRNNQSHDEKEELKETEEFILFKQATSRNRFTTHSQKVQFKAKSKQLILNKRCAHPKVLFEIKFAIIKST